MHVCMRGFVNDIEYACLYTCHENQGFKSGFFTEEGRIRAPMSNKQEHNEHPSGQLPVSQATYHSQLPFSPSH